MAAKQVEGLQFHFAAGEILAQKPGAEGAYALNQAASVVFDLCDGEHSKSEIATAICHRTGLPADEAVVDLALAELVTAGLVIMDEAPRHTGMTRRMLIRRLSLSGAALALLPLVEVFGIRPATVADRLEDFGAQGETGLLLRPTSRPTDTHTGKPTGRPSGRPTSRPTNTHTGKPTGRPTSRPT